MKTQPSQYDCDNMEVGDIVYVRKVNKIYNIYRKLFLKDLNKIKVRDGWTEPVKYQEYYQEDCTLMYQYELACIQKFDNEVPCMLSSDIGTKPLKTFILPLIQVGLYNIQIKVDNRHTYTFPTSYLKRAIEKNQDILNESEDNRKILDALKFQKYKGSYFKDYVIKNSIKEWTPIYCSVCGKSINFKFADDITVENNCDCGSLQFSLQKLSYDEFALWYTNQIVNPSVIKKYNSFWFKE